MKSNTKQQPGGFTLVELLVVIVIIVTLAGVAYPKLLSMVKKGDQIAAVRNGQSMILVLNEFNNDYGSYPDADTAKEVTTKTGSPLSLTGDTANDYFRQIIASGILKSEDPFFAKSSSSTKKPDNLMTPPAECLKAGEVGFGYMMNGTKAIANDDPNRIIAVTPLFNGSAKGEFDSGPLDQKAVFVGVDSSVKALTIRQDNKKVVVNGTKTLLENGEGTIWGADITPVIKVPKKK